MSILKRIFSGKDETQEEMKAEINKRYQEEIRQEMIDRITKEVMEEWGFCYNTHVEITRDLKDIIMDHGLRSVSSKIESHTAYIECDRISITRESEGVFSVCFGRGDVNFFQLGPWDIREGQTFHLKSMEENGHPFNLTLEYRLDVT